jgi:hypothetical protein
MSNRLDAETINTTIIAIFALFEYEVMATIQVDFEVYKELTARRASESMTENDVIRDLLGLGKAEESSPADAQDPNRVPWVTKGVSFPPGTQFRATYKGKQYTGTVGNAALVMSGERYTSPSAAAVAITGNPVNGWRFWECLLPDSSRWTLISNLRK